MIENFGLENYDIFGNVREPTETKRGRRKYKTMQELHGTKEGDDTCKTCVHCVCSYHHGKTYYKCEKWIISHSESTDIRLKNKACKLYERQEK